MPIWISGHRNLLYISEESLLKYKELLVPALKGQKIDLSKTVQHERATKGR